MDHNGEGPGAASPGRVKHACRDHQSAHGNVTVDPQGGREQHGTLAYIELVLRFLLHVPIHKRPVVRTEEDTRPIAMEQEVAKLVAAIIIAHTEQYINDRQWAYQRGRSAGDVACMLTMLLDHTRKGSIVVLYNRGRSNTCGMVDLADVAHLLQEVGVDPPKARW